MFTLYIFSCWSRFYKWLSYLLQFSGISNCAWLEEWLYYPNTEETIAEKLYVAFIKVDASRVSTFF